DAEQVVDRQTIHTRHVADTAAQGQAADASGRDETAGRRQPEGVRRMINIAPHASTLNTNRSISRVNIHALHAREIDDDAIVAGAQSRAVVATAAYCQGQTPLAGKID